MGDHTEPGGQLDYSAKVIAESSHPTQRARMDKSDAWGLIHGCCGDTMEIYLRLNGEQVVAATFMTDGHESAIACANMLCRMACGRSRAEAGRITPDDLMAALDGLPPAKVHCATLAVNTLKKALANQGADEPGVSPC